MRRWLEHTRRRRHRDPALAAARLRLDDLAGECVIDKPDLAVIPRYSCAAVGGGGGLEDQRRHRATGSRAGLKPAASTIWVATRKPAATLSGSCASLPY